MGGRTKPETARKLNRNYYSRLKQDPDKYRAYLDRKNAEARARFASGNEVALAKRKRNNDNRTHYRYGISLEQYTELFKSQGGKCAICFGPPTKGRRLAVDHCHTSKKVRALLCVPCNVRLGYYEGIDKHGGDLKKYLQQYGGGNPLIYSSTNEGNSKWRELHQKAALYASCVMGAMGLAT